MLYEYLTTHYQANEPIFLSNIVLPDVTNNYIRQMFKQLCDSGMLKRFNTGIYYLPASEDTLSPTLSSRIVAEHKYISRGESIYGYYSGQSFAAILGLTDSPDHLLEIVSNNAGGKYREIVLNDTKIILRKPKVTISKENWRILQFLDFLKDIEVYADHRSIHCKALIQNYIVVNRITKESIAPYISEYPDKLYRTIYEMELYDYLTDRSRDIYMPPLQDDSISKPNNSKRRRELSVELL